MDSLDLDFDFNNDSSSLEYGSGEDDDDGLYVYSSENLCWVMRNNTMDNVTLAKKSTYCYYGLGVVIPMSAVLVVSMVLSVGGNCMVILTIARHRGMRTRTNLLLANLAVADILVAVLDMPIALVTIVNGDWIFSLTFCDFNGFTVGLGLMLSTHTLMWISIHKFISITKPFSRSVTPGKIIMMILAAWSWAIFYNLTPTPLIGLTDTEYKLGASQCGPGIPRSLSQYIHSGLNTTFNLVGPFTIMTYCYYQIFKEVKDHLKRMRDFADVSACNSMIEQKQITETLCIVLCVFLLFWLPYIVYSLSLVSLGKKYVPDIANPIAYLCGYMNSACNPIIYALRSPSFRRGFSEIICGSSPQRFSGSKYDRRYSNNGGKMVVSFRRPVFGKEEAGKTKEKLSRKGAIISKLHSMKEEFAVVSTVDNDDVSANISYEQSDLHNGGRKQSPDNIDNKGLVYRNMNNTINVKHAKGGEKNPNGQSEELVHCNVCVCDGATSQETHGKVSIIGPHRTNMQDISLAMNNSDSHGTLIENSPVTKESFTYPNAESEASRKRHASFNRPIVNMSRDGCQASASQPDVTLLPSQNLNVCIDGTRISNSNREILVTTLEIRDNQIRSVSVGDVRVTCPAPSSSVPSPRGHSPLPSCAKDVPASKGFPRHLPNRKHPVVWQPSVPYIFDSPVISRKKFHVRRVAADSVEMSNCNTCGKAYKEKKCSTSSMGKNLGVASLITSVKKSITDLFRLDDDYPVKLEPDIENSTNVRVTPSIAGEDRDVLSPERDAVFGEGSGAE